MKYEIDVINITNKPSLSLWFSAICLILAIICFIINIFDLGPPIIEPVSIVLFLIVGLNQLFNSFNSDSGEKFREKCYISLEKEKAIITTNDSTLLEVQWQDIKQILYQPYKMDFQFSKNITLKFSIAKLEKTRKESLLSDLETKSGQFNFEFAK